MDELKARINEIEETLQTFIAAKDGERDERMYKYLDQAIYTFRAELDSLKSELWHKTKNEV